MEETPEDEASVDQAEYEAAEEATIKAVKESDGKKPSEAVKPSQTK